LKGLGIVVAGTDPRRFRTALTLAAAQAALGGRVRILLDGESVALAATADDLLDSCFELGATITLCQTGMAEAGLDAAALDPRFDHGGMVGWLAELGEDRLVLA
jgi:predicted peroxiredoxin